MDVSGNIKEPNKIKISGSALSDAYNLYDEKMVDPVRVKLISIAGEMDKAEKANDGNKLATLNESLTKIYNSLGDSAEKFIRQNPSSYVSLFLLNENHKLYKAALQKELLSTLDPSLKSFPVAKTLDESLKLTNAVSGKTAPPVAFNDINDKTVVLNSLRGNYVFVVFWASWCVPCLQEMPQLKQAYASLKDKKFKLIMLSLDKEKGKWTAAVSKYELNDFIHGNLPKDFDDPIAVSFDISSIPANCLIGPDGTIVMRNIQPGEIQSYLSKTVQ